MTDLGAIVLDRISLRYGRHEAVRQLSLTIHAGEIFGLLGPNGSGKSSTISAMAGLFRPYCGTIRICGIEQRRQPAEYARLIGYVPQEPALYDELSAVDNLDFLASLYELSRSERAHAIERVLDRVNLTTRGRDRVGTLSGGMRQRLNLAAALLHDPRVLLLDEPSVALDPASRDLLLELLGELKEQGVCIVLTTHMVDEAEKICDRIGLLRNGTLTKLGRPAEVLHLQSPGLTMLGTLRDEIPEETEITIRRQLDEDVTLNIDGRHVRLAAWDGERLGLAIALLASEGVELESFQTPRGRIDVEPRQPLPMGGRACSSR